MDINSAVGRKNGVTEAQLVDLAGYDSSPAFSAQERLALRLTDALCATPAAVPLELFNELRRQWNEEQLVELASAIAWENYRARFNRVFDAGSQGFASGGVCVLHARLPH